VDEGHAHEGHRAEEQPRYTLWPARALHPNAVLTLFSADRAIIRGVNTFAAILLVVAPLGACGGPSAAAPEGVNTAAQINRSKCGACHVPRDPGDHTKAELEPILKKHRDEGRANLSDDDWAKLTDYLARK
jgi:hypothetical protein